MAGCEYRMNGGVWQNSTTFSGLTPNTSYSFTQRLKETATHFASEPSTAAQISTNDDVGIRENDVSNLLKIYPNPVTFGKLTVELPENGTLLTEREFIYIYDIVGQRVAIQTITGTKTEIDVSQLGYGVYLLKAGNMVGKVVKE